MLPLTWRSPRTEVRPSPIQGRGLFAAESIEAGAIVAVKGGHFVDRMRWTVLERELGAAEIQITEELFIAPVTPRQREGSMLYLNHSCNPNAAIQGQIVVVAMRDVLAGEELTHDWATTDDLDYRMRCRCGAACCRGTITGKDWKKRELQEKYRGWFCWFLQRKIDALSSHSS